MAGFVQIIEWKTSRIDEVEALANEMRASREEAEGGPTRVTICADRDRSNTYFTIAEFESREAAEANDKRPETNDFAGRMAELCDGPPTFYNLDLRQSFAMS